jgi:hypothetical protein
MLDFIREAGWGIYPVMAFGLSAVIVAVRQIVSPKAGRVTTASWLMGLTAVAGVLGTATGVQMSARYIHELVVDEKWIFFVGLMESLNNLVAAGVFIVLAMLALLAAHVRSGPLPVRDGNGARANALS